MAVGLDGFCSVVKGVEAATDDRGIFEVLDVIFCRGRSVLIEFVGWFCVLWAGEVFRVVTLTFGLFVVISVGLFGGKGGFVATDDAVVAVFRTGIRVVTVCLFSIVVGRDVTLNLVVEVDCFVVEAIGVVRLVDVFETGATVVGVGNVVNS